MADEEIKLEISTTATGDGGEQTADKLKALKAGLQETGGAAEQAAGNIAGYSDVSARAAAADAALREALDKLPPAMNMVAGGTEKMTESVNEASKAVPQLTETFQAVPDPANKAAQQIQSVQQSATNLAEEIKPTVAATESLAKGFTTLGEQAVVSAPAVTGVTDAFADFARTPVASFNEAVSVASKMNMPFTVLQNSIDAAGISWGDFVGQIGPEAQGQLRTLANNSQYAGDSVGELAKSYKGADVQAQAFFGNVAKENDAIGGFTSALKETASAGEGIGGIFKGFGSAFGAISEGLMTLAMPIFAFQAIGMTIGALGQGIYDMSAIAEGAGAHGVGTFTGQVDALGQQMQKSGEQFSLAFGQQFMPTIDALNQAASQSDSGGVGGLFGGILSTLTNAGMILVGSLSGGAGGPFSDLYSAGYMGAQNQSDQAQGKSLTFTGPGPDKGVTPAQQQLLIQQAQQNYAMAADPQYMATVQSAAYLQAEQQKAIIPVMQYMASHWSGSTGFGDPNNSMIQGEMVRSTGQSYGGGNVDPNAAYFYGLLGQKPYTNESGYGGPGGSPLGGCFPPGTLIILANGSHKPIERVEIGDVVLSQHGPSRVNDTFAYRFKGIYRILFNNATTLYLTDGHPVGTPDGWKSINPLTTAREHAGLSCSLLRKGDRVISVDGSQFAIESITVSHIADKVYNLTVADHTYYASGFLVHNGKLSASVADAVANTQIPPNSLQNSDMMSSITSNFSGLDLNKTFSVSVAWDVMGDLAHQFMGNPAWGVVGDLAHAFMGNPIWGTIGELAHAFMGNPIWGTIGELAHSFMGSPIWGTIGELAHTFMGNPIWGTLGELAHTFLGTPIWNTIGDLAHVFSGVPTWQADGLSHLFSGKAGWDADGLVHTFLAQANWIATGLNPVFNVSAMFTGLPMLAGGIQNFGGGAAIVGENGPELVTLPAGSSVYPNDSLPSIGAQAGMNLAGLMAGGGGGSAGPMVLNLHFDSMLVAQAILPQLATIMRAQFGVMM